MHLSGGFMVFGGKFRVVEKSSMVVAASWIPQTRHSIDGGQGMYMKRTDKFKDQASVREP